MNRVRKAADEKLLIKNVRNRLSGVEVTIMLRDNQEARQFLTTKHREFWQKYFNEAAGSPEADWITM